MTNPTKPEPQEPTAAQGGVTLSLLETAIQFGRWQGATDCAISIRDNPPETFTPTSEVTALRVHALISAALGANASSEFARLPDELQFSRDGFAWLQSRASTATEPPAPAGEVTQADELVAYAIIKGSAGQRAADHAKEFKTANWEDALRSAREVAALASRQKGAED